ncbi:MAG: PKD domain-containing protein [Bacteroidia bacterium]
MNKKLFILMLLCRLAGFGTLQAQVSISTNGPTTNCVPFQMGFQSSDSTGTCSWTITDPSGSVSVIDSICSLSKNFITPGIYQVLLEVSHANGLTETATLNVTAIAAPQPSFSAIPTTVCFQSTPIVFTNSTLGTYDSLMWDFGDGTTSSSPNPSHMYSAAGVFDVKLFIFENGCTSSLTLDDYITILNNPPTAFVADTLVTCNANQVITFTALTSSANYTWYFGDGGSLSGTSGTVQYVYGSAGVYTVTLVTTNAFGCVDTATISNYITIKNNPRPIINVSGGLNSCVPVYPSISTPTGNLHSILWNFGNNTTSTQPSSNQVYTVPGTYNISLNVIYNNGCVNSNSVVLNARPLTSAYFTVSNDTGCAPFTTTLIHQYPGPNLTYQWQLVNGTTPGTSANQTVTYPNAGVYLPSLTVTNAFGCSNTQIATSPIVVSSVNAQFTADDIDGCPPHTVNFSHPGGPGLSYLWNFGNGQTSNLQNPSHTYTTPGSFTVSLTVTNTIGCTHTFTMASPVQISNGINNFAPSDTIYGCVPFTANLFDNSTTSASWLWDFGDGSTSTAANAIHTYQQAGVYHVTLQTQSNGSSCSQNIDPFVTYILTDGQANFSVTNTICPAYTSVFTDSSINAVSWFWDFGDGTTSTLQNPSHMYANPGMYNVSLTITTATGCTYTSVQSFAANFVPLAAYPTDSILSLNPYVVQYHANSSSATSFQWIFGDGGTSTDPNPIHQYPAFGTYDLTLIIGYDTCFVTLNYPAASGGCCNPVDPPSGVGPNPPPVINAPDQVFGCAPLAVSFTNPVSNATYVRWDFGDGSSFSTQTNATHVYTQSGIYTVALLTVNAAGDTSVQTWTNHVHVNAVNADFSASTSAGCSGSTLYFDNTSTPNASYSWNFGDGNHSTSFEPIHFYATTSTNHLITLTVEDSMGCTASKSITHYGSGNNPIASSKRKACKNETISFFSNNPGYASYLWTFGNGDTSTLENPVYAYATGGFYTVSLTVMDSNQCATVFTLAYQIEINAPDANFTYVVVPASCNAPTVNFTNTSTGATSYLWDFGNGMMSTATNPSISINTFGPQTATLTAYAGACSSVLSIPGYFNRPRIVANFTYTQDKICYPITATFTDLSIDADRWLWDFGDGTTSVLQSPVHTFTSKPQADITLTVWNSMGCLNQSVKPRVQSMEIAFNNTSDSIGCAPYPFQISGMSNLQSSWNWNFGNNHVVTSLNATNANASTVYHQNGVYPVSVTVTAPTGCTQSFDTLFTVNANGPIASFSLVADSSCTPTIVSFIDGSSGATSWQWEFGNGNQSNLENPTHVYNVPGNYNVSLIVADSAGCTDTLTQTQAVQVTGTYSNFVSSDPSGCAPWSVSFTDSSVNAASWVWDFGDGFTSSSPNPNHTYQQPGVYSVILITYDSSGCSSAYQLPDSIRVGDVAVASFVVQGTGGCAPYTTSFINNSTNATAYHWDFGDGNTSTLSNPTHQYAVGGSYWVTLIAESLSGCSDTFRLNTPLMVGNIPSGSIQSSVSSGCAPLQVTFSPAIINADSTTQYVWSLNGNTYMGPIFNTTITQNGNYLVSLNVINQAGCSTAFSAPVSVYGADTLGPVVMRSASVLDHHSVELKWADIVHPELDHYRIYRKDNQTGTFNLIHTSYNTLPVNPDVYQTWVDQTTSTGSQTNTYLVQAVNICNLAAPLNVHVPHTTVNLDVDMVSSTPSLQWNDYGGASPAGYLIQRRDDANSPWTSLVTVPASVTNYVDSSVYCADSVAYRITALDLNGLAIFDAFSDVENVMAPGSLLIQRVDMVRSTVEDDSWVLTEWSHPSLAPQLVTGYELYRSTDNINFSRIATLPAAQTSYEDRNVTVKTQNYYYRVKVSNACSLEASPGYESSSILLLANPDPRYGVNLRWTSYKNWDNGVDEYVIEEWNSSTGTWRYVKTVDGTTTETDVQ